MIELKNKDTKTNNVKKVYHSIYINNFATNSRLNVYRLFWCV